MDFKNKIRPIIGVRRAGMAQLEQVQHASVTWLVQWGTSNPAMMPTTACKYKSRLWELTQ